MKRFGFGDTLEMLGQAQLNWRNQEIHTEADIFATLFSPGNGHNWQ